MMIIIANIMLLELVLLALVNIALWLALVLLPPVVIVTRELKLGSLRPRGMAFLWFVAIRQSDYDGARERVLRHEFGHIRQMRMFSPLGLAVLLGVYYGWLWLRHRNFADVYSRSWVERNAEAQVQATTPMPHYVVLHLGR